MTLDPKSWRCSVMSDEEAGGFYRRAAGSWSDSAGALLDEFVRRLGEFKRGRVLDEDCKSAPSHEGFHEYDIACDKWSLCRPAVLFVQEKKVKESECPCRKADSEGGCCRFKANKPNCCICHCACHEDSMPCLKCGRQPEKAKSPDFCHHGHSVPCPVCTKPPEPETVSGWMYVDKNGMPAGKSTPVNDNSLSVFEAAGPARRVTVTLGEYVNRPAKCGCGCDKERCK